MVGYFYNEDFIRVVNILASLMNTNCTEEDIQRYKKEKEQNQDFKNSFDSLEKLFQDQEMQEKYHSLYRYFLALQ